MKPMNPYAYSKLSMTHEVRTRYPRAAFRYRGVPYVAAGRRVDGYGIDDIEVLVAEGVSIYGGYVSLGTPLEDVAKEFAPQRLSPAGYEREARALAYSALADVVSG